jgi:hypothetical protein
MRAGGPAKPGAGSGVSVRALRARRPLIRRGETSAHSTEAVTAMR